MIPSYLQSHYEVEENEYGYQFVTDAGVIYILTFVSYPSASEFLSTNIYMFNIERVERSDLFHGGQQDDKVRNTVLYVLDSFFQDHEDALITICDVSDGKQKARKRLFDSWYKNFNYNRLIKLEAECLIDTTHTSVSLLFSKGHYNQENLKREFQHLRNLNFFN